MPINQQQADSFYHFLASKGGTRECLVCRQQDGLLIVPSIASVEDADNPSRVIRLITTRCYNCGAVQFFDPMAAGLNL
jgi:hypothetical protein